MSEAQSPDSHAPSHELPRKRARVGVPKGKARADGASLKGDVPPLGKYLGSNDKRTRDKAVAALKVFLSRPPGSKPSADGSMPGPNTLFSPESVAASASIAWPTESPLTSQDTRFEPLELAKLFKGLFYCFWMSDKPLVQQALADDLSSLCLVVRLDRGGSGSPEALVWSTRAALGFWKAFWQALMLEWHGVDRHRIDKYLMLTRRFWSVGLRLLERIAWREEAVAEWAGIVRETVLKVEDPKVPVSLAYHLADLALDELHKVLAAPIEPATSIPPAALIGLLRPFIAALSHARPGTTIFQRTVEGVFAPLLLALGPEQGALATGKKRKATDGAYPLFSERLSARPGGPSPDSREVLRKAVLKAIWEEGARQETSDAARRRLYTYWRDNGGDDAEE